MKKDKFRETLKMRKRMVVFCALLVVGMQFVTISPAAAETQKSVKQLSAEFRKTSDKVQRRKLLDEIRERVQRPEHPKDVEDLINAVDSARDEGEKRAIIYVLKEVRVKEEDRQFEPLFIKALDDPDVDIRIMAMGNLGTLKSKAAVPKLRKIVKSYGGLPSKAVKLIDRERAKKEWMEAGLAAMTLGEMKDEGSIPLLAEKLYDLGDAGPDALASMGKKAIPCILDLAKKEKEKGPENWAACSALARIRDKEARQDLIEIVKKEKDHLIRGNALESLVRYMYGDDLFELAKKIYETEGILFGSAMKTREAIPLLTHILLHTFMRPHDRYYAASILGDIGDPAAVPALEKALKSNDINLRQPAAGALKQITGKEYEWQK
ncbi:MAG: HEAT repeat domain-containing protein [Pseudomonadota bacterium]